MGSRQTFENVKLLIHVPLRCPDFHSARDLADIIPHPSEDARQSFSDTIRMNQHERICFLFECCDEAPDSLWKSFLLDFIACNGRVPMIPNVSFILTSLPNVSLALNIHLKRKVINQGIWITRKLYQK